MSNAIIIHGMSDGKSHYVSAENAMSNSNWLPWIQQKLLAKDVLAQTPEMPKPFEPNYKNWLSLFSQFTINDETILIGHSCGGGFIVRWLTENDIRVKKVILVAPWIDPENSIEMFSDFKVGKGIVEKTKNGITIFNSDNDESSVHNSVESIKKNNPKIKYCEFHDFGHFVYKDMGKREFPELLEEALS